MSASSDESLRKITAAKARGTKLGNPNLHLVRNNNPDAATATAKAQAAERNQQVCELITEMEAEQGRVMTTRELAEALNNAGYKTARGAKFSSAQVSRIKAA